MKKILVPTDFSQNAERALDYAIGLAKDEKAGIILVNAWEIVYPATDIAIPMEFISEQLHSAELSAFKQLKPLALKVRAAGIDCDFFNKKGTLVDVVLDMIDKHDIDLVIMGTKGAGGLKEIFIGSNAAHVMQKIKIPIILIPEGAVYRRLKKITYATNYQKSDMGALKHVVELAALLEAEITLLHVSDEHYSHEGAQAIIKLFSEKVKDKLHYDPIAYHIIYGRDAEEKLDEYVQHKHADLFVVSTLERNLFDRWFGRSITKTMAYHTRMPLMIFHHKANAVLFI